METVETVNMEVKKVFISRGEGTEVFIGFGSNLGDSFSYWSNVWNCLQRLKGFYLKARSSLYRSAPVGGPIQPNYLNGVIFGTTNLSPQKLLAEMFAIEREFCRQRIERWGPRTVDLDLLFYGDLVGCWSGEFELILPHPRLHLRRFVLLPLLELNPELIHPKFGRPLKQFLKELSPIEQKVEKLKDYPPLYSNFKNR